MEAIEEHTAVLSITNNRDVPMQYYLEPWGNELAMAPNATFTVTAQGSVDGHFEVELGDHLIAVWAWPASVAQVTHDGEVLLDKTLRVPLIGTFNSVRQFAQFMFGKGMLRSTHEE
jgi:hypothetical protein